MTSDRDLVLLSLGSNIAPEHHLPAAVAMLGRQVELLAVSRVYQTRAVGAHRTAPDFLNAAVAIHTHLEPAELKRGVLRTTESRLGRIRSHDKFAARTIDLDIALFGNRICAETRATLRIPDPDIVRYLHVVLPLARLAPEMMHPTDGRTLVEIAQSLERNQSAVEKPEITLGLATLVPGHRNRVLTCGGLTGSPRGARMKGTQVAGFVASGPPL